MKIEGRNAVSELVKRSAKIEKIYIETGLNNPESKKLAEEIKKLGVRVCFLPKTAMDKESETHRHQGFIAVTEDYKYADLTDVIEKTKDKDGFIIALDGISDPHNLGSIIRVAECVGADGVIITKDRCCPVNETVIRVSEGGTSYVKIARVTNLTSTLNTLKDNGYWVTGAELGGENLYDADLTGKTVIVIGGEDTGLRRLTKDVCDRIVTIPMAGKVNSLNASVACAVVAFEAQRQRTLK